MAPWRGFYKKMAALDINIDPLVVEKINKEADALRQLMRTSTTHEDSSFTEVRLLSLNAIVCHNQHTTRGEYVIYYFV